MVLRATVVCGTCESMSLEQRTGESIDLLNDPSLDYNPPIHNPEIQSIPPRRNDERCNTYIFDTALPCIHHHLSTSRISAHTHPGRLISLNSMRAPQAAKLKHRFNLRQLPDFCCDGHFFLLPCIFWFLFTSFSSTASIHLALVTFLLLDF